MKTILAITRAVVRLATSLHIAGLKALILTGERKVAKAVSKTNLAKTLHTAAQDSLAIARMAKNEAIRAERAIKSEFDALVTAAKAEADTLRSDHTVGA